MTNNELKLENLQAKYPSRKKAFFACEEKISDTIAELEKQIRLLGRIASPSTDCDFEKLEQLKTEIIHAVESVAETRKAFSPIIDGE